MKTLSLGSLLLALIVPCSGCSAASQQKATSYTNAAGAVCEVVVQASDPALAPLCTTAVAVAQAIEALVNQAAATAADAGVMGAAKQPSNDEIYQWLVTHGAPKVK